MGTAGTRRAVRAVRFGDASALAIVDEAVRSPRGNEVVVRVTHAAVGTTDVVAVRGGYVFQPFVGFVPGYDFVGVLETESAISVALGMRVGTRVAATLPSMGAQATRHVVAPRQLVAVPDELDSATAATLPLDALTATLALIQAGPAQRVLVQGATGAVGSLIAQLARREGRTVVGTGTRSGSDVAGDGHLIDYRLPDWPAAVRDAAGGPVDAAIDHTGSPRVREALSRSGVLVHTAWMGRPGHERADSIAGAARAVRRRWAHPRERVVAVPAYVRSHGTEYRRLLASALADAAQGALRTPVPEVHPFDELWDAYRAAVRPTPGRKVVLAMPDAGA